MESMDDFHKPGSGGGTKKKRVTLEGDERLIKLEDSSHSLVSELRSGGGEFSSRSTKNLLELKKDKLNSVFGVRPWALPVSHQPPLEEAEEEVMEKIQDEQSESFCTFGNTLWVVLCGWWLSLLFLFASLIFFLTVVGRPYAFLCWQMKSYLFWPFGKCIIAKRDDSELPMSEARSLVSSTPRGGYYFVWLIIGFIFIFPFLFAATLINWFFVVSIPMGKALWSLLLILVRHPTSISVLPNYSSAQSFKVLLCTYRAFNVLYFQYEFKGVNIVFLNLIPVVLFRVLTIVAHLIDHNLHIDIPTVAQFFLNILCSIPITFYIGTSIASIACQTNYTIGAILNATFGSVTELTLFTLALRESGLNDLILYSLTGSLLCDMLLLPGLAMIVGGIKYKEQQFSSNAAAISSLLLFVAVIGAFTPTIYYHLFGLNSSSCSTCLLDKNDTTNTTKIICLDCKYGNDPIDIDETFTYAVKHLLYLACGVLPAAYLIGLVFTFKTHTHIFDEEDAEEGSAEWSIPFSVGVMLASVTCFGILAEDLVSLVREVLEELHLSQAFLGVTVIALTPAATEIANAIKFALSGQISLSVSIGSASSIQVALIQMPSLVAISAVASEKPFHLVFPLMSVFSVILAVLAFNYISAEGRTNYFVGSSMLTMYILLIASFYFIKDPTPLYPINGSGSTTTPSPPHLLQKRFNDETSRKLGLI